MSSPTYPLLTPQMPGIGQERQTIQRPTEQFHITMSVVPSPVINMTPHSAPQSTIHPNDEFAVSENPCYDDHLNMMNLKSRHPGRIVFPGSSSYVANMSIYAANHTQFNTATMDNTARPQLPTANSIPYNNNSIPMMPNNAPRPQNIYAHPLATHMYQYYGVPSHGPQSLSHGAQYHNTGPGISYSPAMQLNGNATYSPRYVSPNTDPAPPSSYPDLSFYPNPSYHDSGAHHGSYQQQRNPAIADSQPAGPSFLHQPSPGPSMASPPLPAASSPPYIDTQHSPTTHSCRWRVGDHTCRFKGPLDAFHRHFRSSHLIGAQDSLTKCCWQGCKYRRRAKPDVKDMRRDSVLRHVREKHLRMRRGI